MFGGAIHGFLGVAIGAFGSHGFEAGSRAAELIAIGSRYQSIHALALLSLAVLPLAARPRRLTGRLFHLGIGLFSGSLYALALAPELARYLGPVTPLGGTALLVAWATLAITAARSGDPALEKTSG